MMEHRQLLPIASPRSQICRGWLLSLTLCGALLAVGVAAEKREAPAKKDEAASKSDKPPLGTITVLVPKKEFKTEGPNKSARVSFDDIDVEKVLNTKKLSLDLPKQMPEWLKKLDGQRIRLRGYMHPQSAFQEDGLKRFVLCRDTSFCCFGPNPTIYYLVEVTMKSGVSTSYIENKAFDVEGVFHIKPEVLDGTDEVDRFYYLDDAQVIKK
ncbi:MAG: DUF3299 domain-containing protein [Planctomycetota bacterium]